MIFIAINLFHFNSLYNKGLGYYLSFSTDLYSENHWQNDYINMYYEMKEKFEKKYSNKGNKNFKK